jgi:hypothetical protein
MATKAIVWGAETQELFAPLSEFAARRLLKMKNMPREKGLAGPPQSFSEDSQVSPLLNEVPPVHKVARIESKVLCRLGRRLLNFRLQVRDSGLVLQGQARTYHVKQLAQHAVMEATDLPILANEIEVC